MTIEPSAVRFQIGALLRAAYDRGEVTRSTGTRITIWSKV